MDKHAAFWITKPLNAETIFHDRPPVFLRGMLCERCRDAVPEPDSELCAECKEVESRGGNTP